MHAAEPTLYSRRVYVSAELPAAAANARSVVVGDIAAGYNVHRGSGLGVKRQDEIRSDIGQLGYRLFTPTRPSTRLPDPLRILTNSAK